VEKVHSLWKVFEHPLGAEAKAIDPPALKKLGNLFELSFSRKPKSGKPGRYAWAGWR
jgi:hypothetical protein